LRAKNFWTSVKSETQRRRRNGWRRTRTADTIMAVTGKQTGKQLEYLNKRLKSTSKVQTLRQQRLPHLERQEIN